MKNGDKILIQIPLTTSLAGKYLEAEFKEWPSQKFFNQQEYASVIIDNEEWLVPISKIFKKFND